MDDKVRPRIAIYGLVQGDKENIAKFLDSACDADEIVLCDAGAANGARAVIDEAMRNAPGIKLSVFRICASPWRFDDARNTALALTGGDIDLCISLDSDEYLMPGWKEELIRHWHPEVTKYEHPIRFLRRDGRMSESRWSGRIHARRGYIWRLPVNEMLEYAGEEKVKRLPGICLVRNAETETATPADVALLKQAVKERPDLWKLHCALAEALLRLGRHEDAMRAADRAMSLAGADRGELHVLKYRISQSRNDPDEALLHLAAAIACTSGERRGELLFEKGKLLDRLGRRTEAFLAVMEAERLCGEPAGDGEFAAWKRNLHEWVRKEGLRE